MPTAVVGYLLLFAAAAFVFVFGALLLGRFLRPNSPSPEKQRAYECGEPAVGPGDVQFDLRFYVVALVFIIFEVEVAFFFPWATVFGKATEASAAKVEVTAADLGIPGTDEVIAPETGKELAAIAMIDMGIFFGVLMVGFFYVWYRGDLDWVMAVSKRE